MSIQPACSGQRCCCSSLPFPSIRSDGRTDGRCSAHFLWGPEENNQRRRPKCSLSGCEPTTLYDFICREFICLLTHVHRAAQISLAFCCSRLYCLPLNPVSRIMSNLFPRVRRLISRVLQLSSAVHGVLVMSYGERGGVKILQLALECILLVQSLFVHALRRRMCVVGV